MLSDDAQQLLAKIQKRNKNRIVTVDNLIDTMNYSESTATITTLKELQEANLVTTQSVTNRGRFETELIPVDGVAHNKQLELSNRRITKEKVEILPDGTEQVKSRQVTRTKHRKHKVRRHQL
jgi:hypothetical protein